LVDAGDLHLLHQRPGGVGLHLPHIITHRIRCLGSRRQWSQQAPDNGRKQEFLEKLHGPHTQIE
jgi:hypothetical protein